MFKLCQCKYEPLCTKNVLDPQSLAMIKNQFQFSSPKICSQGPSSRTLLIPNFFQVTLKIRLHFAPYHDKRGPHKKGKSDSCDPAISVGRGWRGSRFRGICWCSGVWSYCGAAVNTPARHTLVFRFPPWTQSWNGLVVLSGLPRILSGRWSPDRLSKGFSGWHLRFFFRTKSLDMFKEECCCVVVGGKTFFILEIT